MFCQWSVSSQLTPYTPSPCKNGYGSTDINGANKARDKGGNVQWGDAVAKRA